MRFLLLVLSLPLAALEYAHKPADPQPTGWPLTPEETSYIAKPEYERRPGREINQHLPQLWPAVPSAGTWGGTSWVDTHAKLVTYVQENSGPCDVLLVGDSITQQWGSPLDKGVLNSAWLKAFPKAKTINIGIGGDKTQNVLWRLDHGGVEGLKPRAIVLMIGNNNMFFTPETGVEAAAKGVQACLANLREKFPDAAVVVAKILPCHAPKVPFYEDILKTNAEIDKLHLDADPKVKVLDLTKDFLNADGTIRKDLYTTDNIHLSLDGYAVYAEQLKPLLEAMLAGKPVPTQPAKKKTTTEPATTPNPTRTSATPAAPKAAAGIVLKSHTVLNYPYAAYNEGKMDPQLTGWPLIAEELAWVTKGEYFRKPGHEAQKHLPEMWAVTPTAAHWQAKNGSDSNEWIEHHAQCIEKVQAMGDGIDVAFIGDSITQYIGGGWDGVPWSDTIRKHLGKLKCVNLGIGGDRVENVLWRLDHGALAGASPRVVVLLIGTNNAPLVSANGVPATAVAQGIQLCVKNLRARSPKSLIVAVKILPAGSRGDAVHDAVKNINAAVDALKLDTDASVRVLDLTSDFTNADGSLKTALYSDGHLHLGPAGYDVFASRLKALVEMK